MPSVGVMDRTDLEDTLPTLDEFLLRASRNKFVRSAYVTEPGFSELYVRVGRRSFPDTNWCVVDVLDIANVTAEHPGQGAFTRLAARLLRDGHTLFVECVLNPRFARKLEALGFTRDRRGSPCFYKFPMEVSDEQCRTA